jgi:hypothetical protein
LISGTNGWQFRLTHALDKIYPDWSLPGCTGAPHFRVFLGETASFQIAFRPPSAMSLRDTSPLRVEVNAAAAPHVALHSVDLVPCDLAAFPGHDDGYDRDLPGLYPDLLRRLIDHRIAPVIGGWTGLWVDFVVVDPALAGSHDVEIRIRDALGQPLYHCTVAIQVIGAELPALPIANTHWFHCDGLAQFYGVEVFSEKHWQVIEAFVASASRMQVNTLLTPVWTPPLDTEKGGHRLPTQLLDITDRAGSYTVDFSRLDRWLDLCRRYGIERLEIAHLFTQWGASATPSIYVRRAGQLVEEFGWHVSATDPRYRHFLEQVLPRLKMHLADRWDLNRVIFHISDEPSGRDQLESYLRAKASVEDLIAPCIIIDALSDAEFYDTGAVSNPVVATDAVEPFLARGTDPLWVYYCVGQNRAVSNRFFAMPSSRNRVIGHQLFAYDCAGFLHWGFNFYNSELSRHPINPFQDTTASGAFLGGDAFMVYPGEDGKPLESIRYKVFTQAMFDLRAFHRLAELSGRAAVMNLIDTDGHGGRLRFDAFSVDPVHYLGARNEVNRRIATLAR